MKNNVRVMYNEISQWQCNERVILIFYYLFFFSKYFHENKILPT